MKWKLAVAIIVTIGFIGTPAAAQPGGPAGDRPIEVTVQLGTPPALTWGRTDSKSFLNVRRSLLCSGS